MIGAEKIGYYEHIAIDAIKGALHKVFPNIGKPDSAGSSAGELADATAREGDWTDELEKADAQNEGAGACMIPVWSNLIDD